MLVPTTTPLIGSGTFIPQPILPGNLVRTLHTENTMFVKVPGKGVLPSLMDREGKDQICVLIPEESRTSMSSQLPVYESINSLTSVRIL